MYASVSLASDYRLGRDSSNELLCLFARTEWRDVASSDSVLRQLCWRLGYLPRDAHLKDLKTPRRAPAADVAAFSNGCSCSSFRLDGRDEADATSLQELVERSRLLRKIKFPHPPKSADFAEALSELRGVVKGYANNEDEHRSDIWRFKIE